MMNSEKGQVLPLALLALALGSLVITSFIGYASSNLIGSRVYKEVMTEQYSCDAGIEWVLWRLKENPLLTTNTNYHTDCLYPIPQEINGPSFPTIKIRFVESCVDEEVETPVWDTGEDFDYFMTMYVGGPCTFNMEVETEALLVKAWLNLDEELNSKDPPYLLELEFESAGLYLLRVQTPGFEGAVSMVVTLSYPSSVYDVTAQKDNYLITVRAKASDWRVEVISWQVE